ncbi:polymer-forming cytoskeletal protein [Cyclobacterium xiamenense]|jgi:cytoskeletal protein CcmA (bactofilin family)|uniref:bactofilin family protein n=1 Tax=Cyclobacterium xiamenense TaxID=1297121 RepID=UPI0035D0F522
MWTKERKIQEEMEMASATSVFAPGLSIKGDIEATSDIRIEGDICGNVVTQKKVIVGVSGSVKGDIHASEICVMGEVLGDLFIKGLARFTAEAKMKGTVYSEKIGIEAGADVEVTVSKLKKTAAAEPSTNSAREKDPTKRMKELMKVD